MKTVRVLRIFGSSSTIRTLRWNSENNPDLRAAICADLDQLGLVLDPAKNASLRTEGEISAAHSKVKVFVIPANEELVVARETLRRIAA